MEIEINCDSDVIILRDDNEKAILSVPTIYPGGLIKLFEVLFNEANLVQSINVKLTRISEGSKSTIDEW